jgi:RHS repeat-associated protein
MNQYARVGSTTYGYDSNGNLVSATDTTGATNYTYNEQDLLTSVSGPGLNETFSYDALGHLGSSTVNGQQANYLVDPSGISTLTAAFSATNSLIAHYASGLGLVGQVALGGSATYYDFDALGSTVGLTNSLGGYMNTYQYLPFGSILTETETVPNPFVFVGAWGVKSASSQLSLMGMRAYSSSLGRFTSEDPLRLHTGPSNYYTYAGNQPTDRIDPSGLVYIDIGVAGGYGIGVTGGIYIGPAGVFGYVGVGMTTPGFGGAVEIGTGDPSPGFGFQIQGALGPGVVGVAGSIGFSDIEVGPGGLIVSGGIEVGIGVGFAGSKVTGAGFYLTYTFPIHLFLPPSLPPEPPPTPTEPVDS